MASFASELKNELSRIYDRDINIAKYELIALLKCGTVSVDNHIDFVNSNAAVARKVLKLIKKFFPNIITEVSAIRIKNLRHFNRYYVKIYENESSKYLFQKINSNKMPTSYKAQTAYLRGAFLSSGTINKPQAQYHAEIAVSSKPLSRFIQNIMFNFELPAKIFERKDQYVIYLKNFDVILDFLYLINAESAIEKFEVARNIKEVHIQVNRIMNCEDANINRSINASQRQIKDIKHIFDKGITLKDHLKQTANLRLQNPDLTLAELADKLYISTSGLKGRMRKLHKIAQSIK